MKPTLFALLLSAVASQAAMTFSVNFTAQAQSDLNSTEQGYFTDGVNFWDDIIDVHRDGVDRHWELTVDTFSTPASGGTVLLGSAGPASLGLTNVVPGAGTGAPWPNRFIISTAGNANFNVHPDAGPLDPSTIRHEIGHALGIGTLWEDNEVYNDGTASNSNRTAAGGTPGQYIGAAALAAYQNEFDSGATFIPIELDGGGGTAHGHWNTAADLPGGAENGGAETDPGDGVPAPTDSMGRELDDELMTGFLSGSSFLSKTTIASLYDIGFEVVPEPSTALLAAGGLLLVFRRRRA